MTTLPNFEGPSSAHPQAVPAGGGSFELAHHITYQQSSQQLVEHLNDPRIAVVKVATKRLGETGTLVETAPLARLLHHPDPAVVRLAENSLWCIWLRAGDPVANRKLAEAIIAMDRGRPDRAEKRLDAVIERCPTLAEAYHQRAIALSLMDMDLFAVADARQALTLNPLHFGAAATLGHAYAALGLYERALDAYLTAHRIHPCLDGIKAAIRRVRAMLIGAHHRPPAA